MPGQATPLPYVRVLLVSRFLIVAFTGAYLSSSLRKLGQFGGLLECRYTDLDIFNFDGLLRMA